MEKRLSGVTLWALSLRERERNAYWFRLNKLCIMVGKSLIGLQKKTNKMKLAEHKLT